MSPTQAIADRYAALVARLATYDGVLVAYSGGVDSTLLAVAAREALGERSLAVLANSPVYPASEADAARTLAGHLGLQLVEIETYELDDPTFTANPADRCYHCKHDLFDELTRIAEARGLAVVADGTNADDLADHRPGRAAAAERGVVSPLAELGFTKSDVREAARFRGLPNAEKPSMACLASRFPYGEGITPESLARVDAAETALRGLGLRQFRVRSHGDVARVEVATGELDDAWRHREAITSAVRDAGFAYASLDLQGYRTGSMNEVLPADAS